MNFKNLGVSQELVNVLNKNGISTTNANTRTKYKYNKGRKRCYR